MARRTRKSTSEMYNSLPSQVKRSLNAEGLDSDTIVMVTRYQNDGIHVIEIGLALDEGVVCDIYQWSPNPKWKEDEETESRNCWVRIAEGVAPSTNHPCLSLS